MNMPEARKHKVVQVPRHQVMLKLILNGREGAATWNLSNSPLGKLLRSPGCAPAAFQQVRQGIGVVGGWLHEQLYCIQPNLQRRDTTGCVCNSTDPQMSKALLFAAALWHSCQYCNM
jgi:hypothetical protein